MTCCINGDRVFRFNSIRLICINPYNSIIHKIMNWMRIYVKSANFHRRSAQNGPWWLHCRWISPSKNLSFYFIFQGRFTGFGTQLIEECWWIFFTSVHAISTCRTTRQLRAAKSKCKACGGAASPNESW